MRLLGRKTALERVASFLLRCLPNRNGVDCSGPQSVDDHAYIHLAMTRQEIADYLGLTVETLSRSLSRLRKMSVIDCHRQTVEILDSVRLRSVAPGDPGQFGGSE